MAIEDAQRRKAARRAVERGRGRESYEEGQPRNFGYSYEGPRAVRDSLSGRPGLEAQRYNAILHAVGDPYVRAIGMGAPKKGQGIVWPHVPEEAVDKYNKSMRWLQGEDVQSRPGGHRRYGWDKGERRFEPRRFEYTIPTWTPLAAEYVNSKERLFPQLPPGIKFSPAGATERRDQEPSQPARPKQKPVKPDIPKPGPKQMTVKPGPKQKIVKPRDISKPGPNHRLPFPGFGEPPISTTQALWRDLVRELLHGPRKPEDLE